MESDVLGECFFVWREQQQSVRRALRVRTTRLLFDACLAASGYRSGFFRESMCRSISKEGQRRCPVRGDSTSSTSSTEAPLNHGYSLWFRKYSCPSTSTHTPNGEMFAISHAEEIFPSFPGTSHDFAPRSFVFDVTQPDLVRRN